MCLSVWLKISAKCSPRRKISARNICGRIIFQFPHYITLPFLLGSFGHSIVCLELYTSMCFNMMVYLALSLSLFLTWLLVPYKNKILLISWYFQFKMPIKQQTVLFLYILCLLSLTHWNGKKKKREKNTEQHITSVKCTRNGNVFIWKGKQNDFIDTHYYRSITSKRVREREKEIKWRI